MGCNSSQIHIEVPSKVHPTAQIQSQMNLTQNIPDLEGQPPSQTIPKHPSKQNIQKLPHRPWCFLFGETSMERKIVCFDTNQLQFTTVSSKFKIPEPPVLKYHPIQTIYEQSQELKNSRPPYNFMLAMWLDAKKIFLCGGINFDFDFVSNEAFIYNTQAMELSGVKNNKLGNNLMGSKFEKLPFMATKRYSQMGVVYSVGLLKYVYVFGGRGANNQLLNDCERYSVTENKWSKIASMSIARSTGFSFIYRERIYVCGGYSIEPKRTAKIEVYHPDRDQWQILDIRMHRGLETGSLFSIKPNQLLFVGGNLEYGAINSVVEVNLKDQTYIAVEEMKYPRVLEKGCITDENIIIFGGNMNDGLEIYNYKDEANREWRQNISCSFTGHIKIEEMNSFSYSLETVEVEYNEDALFVIQQEIDITDQRTIIFSHDSSPFILDVNFTKQTITKKPVSMALRLRSHMQCLQVSPGKYFICGGVSEFYEKSSRSCYIYDVATNKAEVKHKMISARYNFAMCAYKDEIYVFGGRFSEDDEPLYSCQKLSISENCWILTPSLIARRHSAKAMPIKDKIYIVGGSNGVRELDDIEVYDPQKNIMVLVDIFMKLIQFVQVARREDEVYIFAGKSEDKQRMYKLEVVVNTSKQKAQLEQAQQVVGQSAELDVYASEQNSQPVKVIQQFEEQFEKKQQKPSVKKQKDEKEIQHQNQHVQSSQIQADKQSKLHKQQHNIDPIQTQQSNVIKQQAQQQQQPVQNIVEDQDINLNQQNIPGPESPNQSQKYPDPQPFQELTAEATFFEAPQKIISCTSGFPSNSIYFFSTDCLVYKWEHKTMKEVPLKNIQLLECLDFDRVTFS